MTDHTATIKYDRMWWIVRCTKNPKVVVIGQMRDSTLRRAEAIYGVTFEDRAGAPEAA